MSHSVLYQGSRSQLVKQLVYFDEERFHFLDQYFPDFGPKRSAAERLIADYVAEVERISADPTPENMNATALIGSQLEIRYLDDGDDAPTETLTIVFPHLTDPDRNRVSVLSPLGYQLLLAKTGQTYQLDVPSGQISVRVENIKFVNNGETPL